jgi:pimeloyl-ACP methyl ester carboxylesterase
MRTNRRWSRRAFIAAGLSLGGCAQFDRPPLGVLHGPTRGKTGQPPVVLVPGAFGSILREGCSGREVWPGSSTELITSDYQGLEVGFDPVTLEPRAGGIEACDLFEHGLGRDFYGQLLGTLEQIGGYVRCLPGVVPRVDQRNYYVYPYDFRLDNVSAARGLHELIERIRTDHGDPRLLVDVLAHSNGGLLARYYARYGTADLPESGPFAPTGAGAKSIRRLLLVGTPNLGTMQPVLSLLRGERMGLRKMPEDVIATWASGAQMMPHPALPWILDVNGGPLDCDLFDIETWRSNGWSVFDPQVEERAVVRLGGGADGRRQHALLCDFLAKHLERGRRFMESLTVPAPGMEPRTSVFGGDCERTLTRMVAERVGGRLLAREDVADIAAPVPGVDYEALMFEPGDTVVTRSSLLGRRSLDTGPPRTDFESPAIAHSVFLCERHSQLTTNPSFQDELLNALLSGDAA